MFRADGHPAYLSAGLLGHAALHVGWLTLALAARWDGYQSVVRDRPRHLEMITAGGGLWALARALERGSLSLDAGLTFWVLGIAQTFAEGDAERGGHGADVRTGAIARARLGRGALRPQVALDFELSPTQLHENQRLDRSLPTLPAWSLGLTLGVAWRAS